MSIRRQLLTFVIVLCAAGSCWGGTRERLSLDGGWLFHLGDVAAPPIKGHGIASWAVVVRSFQINCSAPPAVR